MYSSNNAPVITSSNYESWKTFVRHLVTKGLFLSVTLVNFIIFVLAHSISRKKPGKLENYEFNRSTDSSNVEGTIQLEKESNDDFEVGEAGLGLGECLREAEVRNEALKLELQRANKIRLALEDRCASQERENARIEDELEEAEISSAIEIERLTKELTISKANLEQILKERDLLSCQVELSLREDRLAESTLKTQTILVEDLKEVQEEVARLERIVLLAKDPQTFASGEDTPQERSHSKYPAPVLASPEREIIIGYDKSHKTFESSYVTYSEPNFFESYINVSEQDNMEKEESTKDFYTGPVTGSAAFRNFLLSMINEK